jgi:predicted  nucleic acid-binding Zn-ribbon protein
LTNFEYTSADEVKINKLQSELRASQRNEMKLGVTIDRLLDEKAAMRKKIHELEKNQTIVENVIVKKKDFYDKIIAFLIIGGLAAFIYFVAIGIRILINLV